MFHRPATSVRRVFTFYAIVWVGVKKPRFASDGRRSCFAYNPLAPAGARVPAELFRLAIPLAQQAGHATFPANRAVARMCHGLWLCSRPRSYQLREYTGGTESSTTRLSLSLSDEDRAADTGYSCHVRRLSLAPGPGGGDFVRYPPIIFSRRVRPCPRPLVRASSALAMRWHRAPD